MESASSSPVPFIILVISAPIITIANMIPPKCLTLGINIMNPPSVSNIPINILNHTG